MAAVQYGWYRKAIIIKISAYRMNYELWRLQALMQAVAHSHHIMQHGILQCYRRRAIILYPLSYEASNLFGYTIII